MAEDLNEGALQNPKPSLEESLERINKSFGEDPARFERTRVFLDDDRDPTYVYIDGYKTQDGVSVGEIRLLRTASGGMKLYHNIGSNIDASYELGLSLQELGIDATSIGGHLGVMTPEKQERLDKYNADLASAWKDRNVGKTV